MKRWKRRESQAAKSFGVKRNTRSDNFGISAPDTTPHPVFSIEVKSRKKLSSFIKDGLKQALKYDKKKIPLLVLFEMHAKDGMVVLQLSDFKKFLSEGSVELRWVQEKTEVNNHTVEIKKVLQFRKRTEVTTKDGNKLSNWGEWENVPEPDDKACINS